MKTIVVTAFGAFGGFNVNPSETVIRKLEDMGLGRDDIQTVFEVIPVNYDIVSQRIPELWNKHTPVVSTLFSLLPSPSPLHSLMYL